MVNAKYSFAAPTMNDNYIEPVLMAFLM